MTLLKADLHIHSNHSPDSKTSVEAIIHEAIEKGFDVISITDHNTVRGSLEAEKIIRKKKLRLRLVVGQETMTRQGEILIYNIREDVPNHRPLEETCRLVKKKGGIIVPSHPYDPLRKGIKKNMELVVPFLSAVETFNPKNVFSSSNKKAFSFAASKNLPAIANSDAHLPSEVGRSHTIFQGNVLHFSVKGMTKERTPFRARLRAIWENLWFR